MYKTPTPKNPFQLLLPRTLVARTFDAVFATDSSLKSYGEHHCCLVYQKNPSSCASRQHKKNGASIFEFSTAGLSVRIAGFSVLFHVSTCTLPFFFLGIVVYSRVATTRGFSCVAGGWSACDCYRNRDG